MEKEFLKALRDLTDYSEFQCDYSARTIEAVLYGRRSNQEVMDEAIRLAKKRIEAYSKMFGVVNNTTKEKSVVKVPTNDVVKVPTKEKSVVDVPTKKEVLILNEKRYEMFGVSNGVARTIKT